MPFLEAANTSTLQCAWSQDLSGATQRSSSHTSSCDSWALGHVHDPCRAQTVTCELHTVTHTVWAPADVARGHGEGCGVNTAAACGHGRGRACGNRRTPVGRKWEQDSAILEPVGHEVKAWALACRGSSGGRAGVGLFLPSPLLLVHLRSPPPGMHYEKECVPN